MSSFHNLERNTLKILEAFMQNVSDIYYKSLNHHVWKNITTCDSLIPPSPGSHVACRLVSQSCVVLLTKLSTLHSEVRTKQHKLVHALQKLTHKGWANRIIFNDMKQGWYTLFFISFSILFFLPNKTISRVYLAPGCQVVMRKLSGYGNLQLPTPGSQRWITSTTMLQIKQTPYINKSMRKGTHKKKQDDDNIQFVKNTSNQSTRKNMCFFRTVFGSSFSSSLSVSPESDSTSPAAIRRLSLLSPKHTNASGGRNPFSGFYLVDMAGRNKI